MTKGKILCLLILLSTLSGCATMQPPLTPRAELRIAQVSFEKTVDSIIILKDAEKFNDDEWEDIIKLVDSGEELLTQWTLAVIREEIPTVKDKFYAVLNQLRKYKRGGE